MNPEELRIFSRVADLSSFSRAADELGLTKSRVSNAVHQIEANVGARLLHRTTRSVSLTQDGEKFLERCKEYLAVGDDLTDMFRVDPGSLTGRLRINVPIIVAREVIVPKLPLFLRKHPLLEVAISTDEREIDPVHEGFDCVLRTGALQDSELVARKLGFMPMSNAASPSYLREHGTPKALEDLDRHVIVHRTPALTFKDAGFKYFDRASKTYKVHPMGSKITVNGTDAYFAAAVAGLGLIQAPTVGLRSRVAQGALVFVMPKFNAEPVPVSLVYPNRHQIAPRVQAMMDWIAEAIAPNLEH